MIKNLLISNFVSIKTFYTNYVDRCLSYMEKLTSIFTITGDIGLTKYDFNILYSIILKPISSTVLPQSRNTVAFIYIGYHLFGCDFK